MTSTAAWHLELAAHCAAHSGTDVASTEALARARLEVVATAVAGVVDRVGRQRRRRGREQQRQGGVLRPRGACRGSARAFHSRFSRHNRQGGVKWEIRVATWKTQLLEVKCFELCFPCCHTSKTEREQRGRGREHRARRPLSTRGARRTGSGGEGLVAARTAHCALGWNRLRRLYVASIQ